jgi:prepilin-type N-terminal cleavage/methylation domain-containing protein
MKQFRHTLAFTMIELVFVIAVIGIVSALALPRFDRDNLQEAADQLVSHIRYTQHLAMQDDKFNTNDPSWYLGRWRIQIYENLSYTNATCPVKDYNGIWAYTIYSDESGYTGNPNLSEMARNPSDQNQYLSGGYNNTLCVDNENNGASDQSMASMRLNTAYGIQDIVFGGGCRSNVRYLNFDYMGRPFNSMVVNSPYQLPSAGWHRQLTQRCTITLCTVTDCTLADLDEQITVAIEPETGYAHIL